MEGSSTSSSPVRKKICLSFDATSGEVTGTTSGRTSPQSSVLWYSELNPITNPKPQQDSAPQFSLAGTNGDKVVIVMVGLPATGKTFVARRLKQYLTFFHGAATELFNVGNKRRELHGAHCAANFFDSNNAEAMKQRQKAAEESMNDLKKWLTTDSSTSGGDYGKVAIYDATNTTRKRRKWIQTELNQVLDTKHNLIYVEIICKDESIIESNIRQVKLNMPDYEGVEASKAVEDFKKRILNYKEIYECIDPDYDNEMSFIKLIDGGKMAIMNNIKGFLQGRIVHFLSSLHTIPRCIYLSRHGESEYNEKKLIGGDSSLSAQGELYATALAEFAHEKILDLNKDGSFKDPKNKTATHARLFTSSLKRTRETAKHIKHPHCDDGWVVMRPRAWKALDEIYAGVFDGMTYDKIKELAPDEFEARSRDKLVYRYPRGESYLDVIQRLDPIIHELERQRDPMLIIGHQGILRIIYSYFMGSKRETAPFVSIPLNTVIKLTPGTYDCEVERIPLINNSSGDEPPSH